MEKRLYTPAELNAYAFVKEPAAFDSIASSCTAKVMADCINKNKLMDTQALSIMESCNYNCSVQKGCVPLMGWCFDFRPFMKNYLVKRYGQWQEYYGFNKTLLRKMITGKIDKIVEFSY